MIRDLFSTGAMGALAPAILKIGLLVPAILGQSNTVSTLNSKVLNTPLQHSYIFLVVQNIFEDQMN